MLKKLVSVGLIIYKNAIYLLPWFAFDLLSNQIGFPSIYHVSLKDLWNLSKHDRIHKLVHIVKDEDERSVL